MRVILLCVGVSVNTVIIEVFIGPVVMRSPEGWAPVVVTKDIRTGIRDEYDKGALESWSFRRPPTTKIRGG